ncbi:putative L-azetidine-2-carboxylate N-acetyltransferase, partial [Lentinula aciculospora]
VKLNYPGRPSHISYTLNAGFLVPPIHRKGGFGSILAKLYMRYALKLGYRASVFNLIFVHNDASMR